jgi:hypothetical protein
MALTSEQQIEAIVDQSFGVHALAHADFIQQINSDLLEHTSTDTTQNIVARLALNDDGINARFVQKRA